MLSAELTHELDAMDRGAIDALIRRVWRERLRFGADAVPAHTTPDVVFRIVGAGGMSGEAVHEGQEALIDAVRAIDTNLEFLAFDILDLIVDGRRAALLWRATLRNRGTGVTGELAVFDIVEIENGLIASYTEFLDSDGFRRLMAGEPQPPQARRSNRALAIAAGAVPDPAFQDLAERDRTEAMLRAFRLRRAETGAEAITEFCTEDCELLIIGDPSLVPFARHHVGREAVRALVEQVEMEFICQHLVIDQVLVDGNRAAVRWTADVRHRGTGAEGRVRGLDHIVMANGRVRAVTEFFDTAATAGWIAG